MNSVLRQLAELQRLDRDGLEERWRSLIGGEPPAYSRDLLVRRPAHRIQELAYGGLPEATKQQLRAMVPDERTGTKGVAATRMARKRRKSGIPVPGTWIIRVWGDRRHEVTVLPNGFEYEGRKYRSLTAIANHITGSHWNGRLFFGLRGPGKKKGA